MEKNKKDIIQHIYENCLKYSEKIAVINPFNGKKLSYKEVWLKSGRMKKHLTETKGLQKGNLVAIKVQPDTDALCLIIAILRCGATWLPLDLKSPANRTENILKNSRASLYITDENDNNEQEKCYKYLEAEELYKISDNIEENLPDQFSVESEFSFQPDDTAYVIYTSGSTGEPKGVEISRSALNIFARTIRDVYQLKESDKVLQFASWNFDASIEDIFPVLCCGGQLVLFPNHNFLDIPSLFEFLIKHEISAMYLPTALWHNLVNTMEEDELKWPEKITTMIIGGEAASSLLWNKWLKLTEKKCRIFNAYGPTEATVVSNVFTGISPENENTVPIGRELPYVKTAIMDNAGRKVKPETEGELWISGPGLAKGYLHDPELTEKMFIKAEIFNGERFYKTGDLVIEKNGQLIYKGRIDRQIKLRGYRIDCLEIENMIMRNNNVRQVAVIPEDEQLFAFIEGKAADPDEIQRMLKLELPPYMLPVINKIEKIPLNSSGKTDLSTLRKLICKNQETEKQTETDFQSEVEKKLTEIIREFKGLSRLEPEDNFFSHGLDSLRAMQFCNRIKKETGNQLNITLIYENPTIRSLCKTPELHEIAKKTVEKKIIKEKWFPLNPMQQCFYMLENLYNIPAYNLSIIFRIPGKVNPEIFRQTINLIYSRHHCLRTIFQLQKNGVFQSFKNGEEAEIKIETAENCQTYPWRESPFSYEEGPLFRVWLIQGNNHDEIIFNVHHIIIDGWSSGILIKDFNTIYAALSRNEKPELPEIKISFQDYILEKMEQKENQKWLNSENYWKKKFANLPFQFIIPTDYPRPNTVFFPASNYNFHISREEKQLLDNLATTHKTTVFIILISAFKLLIAELSQQSDICAGTVFSNRNQEEYEHIVGPFMNILPLRTIIPEAGNVREILSIVEKTFTEALSHHEYPFSEIVAACRKNQEESFSNPLFQVMFIYQTYHFPELKTGDLCGQYIHTERAYTETDFTFYAEDNKDGGININIEYAENLFKKENIIKWAEVFQEKLKNLLAGKIDKKSVTDHKPEQIQPSLRSQNKEYDILKLIIDSCHKNKKSTAATDPFLKEEISYEELLSQAETTAARLQKMGVRENSIVAIQLPPGLKALTILPAIMMCGAAWLPLDLKSPPKRILEILCRSSADFYIVPAQNDNKNELQITEITTKIITEEELFTPTQNAPKYKTVLNPDKTAYIIYTSGTTGESKGVEISRKALGIFAFNAVKLYNFSAEDRVMQLASWAFDASMEEIFCSLISGANLILMPNHKLNDIKTFLDFVKTNEITVLDLPTAFWHLITKTMEDEKIQLSDSVQKVIIGGEAASSEVWRKWHKMVPNNVKTFNTYGPTEATIVATSFCKREIDSSSPTVPIGKALPHVRTFILDNNRDPVKTGETGELWLGGEGLAKGYLKDKNLTEKMFIMHKQLNMRLYKTGDLVIQTDKGDLIFQGRTDRQIKLRGYRIDCMEVENVIRNHPGVKQNTVGMHNNQLYAFIVAPEKIMPDIAVFLQKELPAYMIPILKNVTEIPLNNSGKIDFKLLCKNIDAEQLSFTEKPETDSIAENIILQIWQRTIDNKSLKSTDDFFECGGNSLLALQLIHQLSLSGFKVNMGDIFLYPTVRKMAENLKINTLKNETSTYPPCIVQMGHSQNDKKKLFLMHSIPGDILGYTELVRELNPEISCYGIQSPGMTNPDMIQADIYKMAAIYADQIISFHKGPLSIAGWCYGGVLAVEVANEFLRRGKAVDFVGVMELGLPETDKLRLQRYLIRNLNILKSGPSAWKRFLKLQNFYKRLFQGKEQRVYALEYDSGFLANRSTIAKANASFLPAYKMKNFPPLINLFFGEPVYKNPQEEWNIFTRTKTHFFSAGHRSILNHPTVKDLAETIKKLILD